MDFKLELDPGLPSNQAQARAEDSQPPHEIADEIGKPVHGHRQSEERVGPFLFQPARPRGDGEGTHEKSSGGLGEGPAAGCAEFDDRQPGRGWIIGASVGLDLFHAGVLDANLLAQERDLTSKPFEFGLKAESGIKAVSGPAERLGESEIGQGDGMHRRGANVAGPASGQGKGTGPSGIGYGGLPQGIQN
jgi:hypothetical protein